MATSAPSPRRIYLTQRLVNKQITMEEATELFTLMAREVSQQRKALMTFAGRVAPAGGEGPSGMASPPPPPGYPSSPGILDNLDELLLYGGPLLGLLAALMKRSCADLLGGTGTTADEPTSRSRGSKGALRTASAPGTAGKETADTV